jgi:DNA-binding Lrp family transcriptional regulator
MNITANERSTTTRRPRFRRASEPPAFRLTDDDVEIVRQLARYRFLRSTHIAALVRRSLDRTNDRLKNLFHAGYIDRPRAQLDYYPTSGSAPIVYALADRGARLLRERDGIAFKNLEWSRKNRQAGRPFVEHQIEVVNFQVALESAVRDRSDVRLLGPKELTAGSRSSMRPTVNVYALRAKLRDRGALHESRIIPDLVFGLALGDGSRRNFMVEIDRGTMPIRRSDPMQTSFEKKLRIYRTAHAMKQHDRQFGWKNFRVLTVTTQNERMVSLMEVSRQFDVPGNPSITLFLFATFDELRRENPLHHLWNDVAGRRTCLL